jgi:hypothetical protein
VDLSSAGCVRAVADEAGLWLTSREVVRRLRDCEELPDVLREAGARLVRRFDWVLAAELVRFELTDWYLPPQRRFGGIVVTVLRWIRWSGIGKVRLFG